MQVEFFIPGQPVSKGRPRFTVRPAKTGTFARAYTPAKTRAYETTVAQYAKIAIRKPLDGPVRVDLVFTMPIPQSLSKTRQKALIGQPHAKKPDLDNLIKSCFDPLNGIAWADDSQVCELHARKVYGETPGVLVRIQFLLD